MIHTDIQNKYCTANKGRTYKPKYCKMGINHLSFLPLREFVGLQQQKQKQPQRLSSFSLQSTRSCCHCCKNNKNDSSSIIIMRLPKVASSPSHNCSQVHQCHSTTTTIDTCFGWRSSSVLASILPLLYFDYFDYYFGGRKNKGNTLLFLGRSATTPKTATAKLLQLLVVLVLFLPSLVVVVVEAWDLPQQPHRRPLQQKLLEAQQRQQQQQQKQKQQSFQTERRPILDSILSTATATASFALDSGFPFNPTNANAAEVETSKTSPSVASASLTTTTTSRSSTKLQIVTDPNSYSALAYAPPPPPLSSSNSSTSTDTRQNRHLPPLILVLHGAGRNDLDILSDLGDINGEHGGLIPSLIASSSNNNDNNNIPPDVLLNNFAMLAPYSYGQSSFYQDSRSKLLQFVNWAMEHRNSNEKGDGDGVAGADADADHGIVPNFDPNNIWLFGFSDGATVAVELLTTRRFRGAVICSYGYSGKTLPPAALQRLVDLPITVFHSADDVIFNVANSDRFIQQLNSTISITTTTTTTTTSMTSDTEKNTNPKVQIRNIPPSSSSSSLTSLSNNSNVGTSTTTTTTAAAATVNNIKRPQIQYYRYDQDPLLQQMPARVRGHVSMAIVASKMPEVYEWMLEYSK